MQYRRIRVYWAVERMMKMLVAVQNWLKMGRKIRYYPVVVFHHLLKQASADHWYCCGPLYHDTMRVVRCASSIAGTSYEGLHLLG